MNLFIPSMAILYSNLSFDLQFLSVTADNASNNDTMVEELATLIEDFDGDASRTRCFLHIVNLVAKSLLKQFDVPKKKADAALDEAEKELMSLAEDLEWEERVTVAENGLGDDASKDDVDGLVDEVQGLSEQEKKDLIESITPVRLVLVKVCLRLRSLWSQSLILIILRSASSPTLLSTRQPLSFPPGTSTVRSLRSTSD